MLPTVAAERHRRHVMYRLEAGSYVVYDRLPELGSGEIVASEKGCVRIRFASTAKKKSKSKAKSRAGEA